MSRWFVVFTVVFVVLAAQVGTGTAQNTSYLRQVSDIGSTMLHEFSYLADVASGTEPLDRATIARSIITVEATYQQASDLTPSAGQEDNYRLWLASVRLGRDASVALAAALLTDDPVERVALEREAKAASTQWVMLVTLYSDVFTGKVVP